MGFSCRSLRYLAPCILFICMLALTTAAPHVQTFSSEVEQAVTLLESLGVQLCRSAIATTAGVALDSTESLLLGLPSCGEPGLLDDHRRLQEDEEPEGSKYTVIVNLVAAFLCICTAALAAGLTLGMLGLDPLMLLIKERAADSEQERARARKLLPIIQQRHRLLVTLLLMNSISNEALPIFLEKMVPPPVAILLSVTLVLFFGEIIPSAIFTGPDQLEIASKLTNVVRTAMFLLYPLAGPIAKMLDWILHDDTEGDSSAYNRGELSALIRIQYEERLANKQKRKRLRQQAQAVGIDINATGGNLFAASDHVGALDFTPLHRNSLRANMNQLEHLELALATTTVPSITPAQSFMSASTRNGSIQSAVHSVQSERASYERPALERTHSIHQDEVAMVEGALMMKTKVALDVYTAMRRTFCAPADMILNQVNLVNIYASGFSRVPVYEKYSDVESAKEKDDDDNNNDVDVNSPPLPRGGKWRIVGVLITKQLIVVGPRDERPLGTLPLYVPLCVNPGSSLVDLLNLFQTGGSKAMGGGHLALVCASPHLGNKALQAGKPLPKEAGLMGIITLEDVLEALLQEQIYDEMDRYEREGVRLQRMVIQKWRRFASRKKKGLSTSPGAHHDPGMLPVVVQAAMVSAGSPAALEEGIASEMTALLASQTPSTN